MRAVSTLVSHVAPRLGVDGQVPNEQRLVGTLGTGLTHAQVVIDADGAVMRAIKIGIRRLLCSNGSTLVFIKSLEGKDTAARIFQVVLFALTRVLFIGSLGVLAAVLGGTFFGVQKAWVVLGALIAVTGLLFITGRTSSTIATIGPGFSHLSSTQGSIGLGLLFGFNIPACTLPILAVLLSVVAAHSATGIAAYTGYTNRLLSRGCALRAAVQCPS